MAYAEDCKSFYTGSIPVPTSKKRPFYKKKTCFLSFFGINRFSLFQRSSVVEQSAVNRSVVGSSPTAGAIKAPSPPWGLFSCLNQTPPIAIRGCFFKRIPIYLVFETIRQFLFLDLYAHIRPDTKPDKSAYLPDLAKHKQPLESGHLRPTSKRQGP